MQTRRSDRTFIESRIAVILSLKSKRRTQHAEQLPKHYIANGDVGFVFNQVFHRLKIASDRTQEGILATLRGQNKGLTGWRKGMTDVTADFFLMSAFAVPTK
jgi:hypothetical protein